MVETATLVAIIGPLYGMIIVIIFRQGKLMQSKADTDKNEQNIRETRRSLAEIEREVSWMRDKLENLEQDHEMLHDNTTEENFCGSEACRFCDRD